MGSYYPGTSAVSGWWRYHRKEGLPQHTADMCPAEAGIRVTAVEEGFYESWPTLAEAQEFSPEEIEIARAVRAELGEKVMAYVDDDMWKRLIRGGACFPKNREKETADLIRRTVDWRRDLRVDTILEDKLPQTAEFHKGWPSHAYGEDQWGHPIVVERIQDIDASSLMKSLSEHDITLHRTQVMEALQQSKQRGARRRGHRLYKHVVVFDLSGLSLSHLNKDNRTIITKLIKLSSDYYCETLWKMFIINAPYTFRSVWGVFKRFVEPETIEKIQILGGQDKYLPAMQQAGIPLQSLPDTLGGSHQGRAFEELIDEEIALCELKRRLQDF